jgi:hypothetical protein
MLGSRPKHVSLFFELKNSEEATEFAKHGFFSAKLRNFVCIALFSGMVRLDTDTFLVGFTTFIVNGS